MSELGRAEHLLLSMDQNRWILLRSRIQPEQDSAMDAKAIVVCNDKERCSWAPDTNLEAMEMCF